MAGSRHAFNFARARRAAFDELVSVVEERLAGLSGEVIQPAPVADLDKAVMDALMLTDRDARRASWSLIGRGLRHMRDMLPEEPVDTSTVVYAARESCLRRASLAAGFFVDPPQFEEMPHHRASLAQADMRSHVHAAAGIMVTLVERDVPDSVRILKQALGAPASPVKTPELPELKVPRDGIVDFQAGFLKEGFMKAQEDRFSSGQAAVFRAQMSASVDTLAHAYAETLSDFRRSLGMKAPAPARPRLSN